MLTWTLVIGRGGGGGTQCGRMISEFACVVLHLVPVTPSDPRHYPPSHFIHEETDTGEQRELDCDSGLSGSAPFQDRHPWHPQVQDLDELFPGWWYLLFIATMACTMDVTTLHSLGCFVGCGLCPVASWLLQVQRAARMPCCGRLLASMRM